jgi:hypothetical protein
MTRTLVVVVVVVALAQPAAARVVARRSLASGALELEVDRSGVGRLVRVDGRGRRRPVACDGLPGAWGLWVADVDGEGKPEAVVALRKRARFDPVLENRLHVYSLVDGRCVPLWRGTRLAGRFDRLAVQGGRLLALERIGGGRRRVAQYRWTGFGYAVERVIWSDTGALPGPLARLLGGR